MSRLAHASTLGWMVRRLATVLFAVILCTGCDPDAATQNLNMLNQLREQHGLQPLTRVAELDIKSVVQADRMARRGRIFHSSPAQMKQNVPAGWSWIGENVCVGGSAQACHDGFVGSPSHLANLLRPEYNQVGVGVISASGRLWLVQTFVAR